MIETPPSSRWAAVWHVLTQNPITIKELRSRMRGRRAFAVLTIYLLLATALVALIYASVSLNSTPSPSTSRGAGQATFVTMLFIQGFLVIFMSPAFTAGAISGEKERQTFELLRTTLLSPNAFVLGKLISALSYIFLLIITAVPLLSLSFMLGGITLSEVIISQLLMVVTAVTYAMLGLYFSCRMKSTISASVATLATAFFLTAGLPLLALIFGSIFSAFLFSGGGSSWVGEMVLAYAGLALSVTNLPATLVISDIFLREENSLWGMWTTFGGRSFWFFSPWYANLLFHSLLSLLYFRLTTRRVGQIANQ
jgi:ABC-2 type transport system permease protein